MKTYQKYDLQNNHTGTSTLENMLIPLRASINATSWGVETINAPITKPTIVKNQMKVAKPKLILERLKMDCYLDVLEGVRGKKRGEGRGGVCYEY